MVRGGPALRPAVVTRTRFVGVKVSLVSSGAREMSTRLPVTVAAGTLNAKEQRSKGAKRGNLEASTLRSPPSEVSAGRRSSTAGLLWRRGAATEDGGTLTRCDGASSLRDFEL